MITSKNKNKITGLNQFPVRNEHYQRNTVKQPIPALKCIALFYSWVWICPRLPNNAIGFLHVHWLRASCFSQRQGFNQLLVFFISFKIWVFFFLNTSYPFPETTDLLLLFSGLLQNFYHLIGDSSFKSNGSSLPLIRSQITRG